MRNSWHILKDQLTDMPKPITIQFFLPDGEPHGVRMAEVTTRTVQAICVPRNRLSEAHRRPELTGVGVYFLFGEREEAIRPRVYIGEAEHCGQRLKLHNQEKDFWQTAVAIVSRTSTFTKAHVRYLEWYSLNEAQRIGRYDLENSNAPKEPFIPEPMKADCLDAFESLSLLLGSLGFGLFEPYRKPTERALFYCKRRGADAQGSMDDEGFTIYAGSTIPKDMTPSGRQTIGKTRKGLQDGGVLEEKEGGLVFVRNHTFRTPSGAADVVVGSSSNGWVEWKNKAGKTLDEVKRKRKPEE